LNSSLFKHKDDNQLLLKITAMGWLVYKLSTLKLWFLHDRNFPVIPVSDSLKILVPEFHIVLSALGLFMLVVIIFKPHKSVLIAFLLAETALQLTDVMRWQPAAFQFYISFVAFVVQPKKFKFYLLLLLSATYIYAGLHKLNLRFINFTWATDILIGLLNISTDVAYSKLVKGIGFIIPCFEMMCGILILTKWRKWAFYGIILTHTTVLLYISPLGLNHNSAVWGWNVIMIVYALYFLKNSRQEKLRLTPKLFNLFWIVLIYVLPILNVFEYYYPYFSFDLYSGNRYYLILNSEIHENHPLKLYTNDAKETKSNLQLNTFSWSLEDINTPLTHNTWLYKKFIEAFEEKYPELEPCYEIQYYPYKTSEIFHFKKPRMH